MSAEIVDNKSIYEGYIYYRGSVRGAKQHWECKRYRNNKDCKARATTSIIVPGKEIIVYKGPRDSKHEHPANHDECAAEKVKATLKRKAGAHPEQPPAQLLRTELGGARKGRSH